ncbi:hypothetical protein ACOME3_007478 [Neoechinorhynchus agilis]
MVEQVSLAYRDQDADVLPLKSISQSCAPSAFPKTTFGILHRQFTQWIMKQNYPLSSSIKPANSDEHNNSETKFDPTNATDPTKMGANYLEHEMSALSMIVHRVKNNLFVDKFNTAGYSGNGNGGGGGGGVDLKWLAGFNRALGESWQEIDDPKLVEHIERLRDLFIHFLIDSVDLEAIERNEATDERLKHSTTKSLKCEETPADQPVIDITFVRNMSRSFLWTFDGIRMLVESSLPMFGTAKHPLINLQLNDVHEPVTVLTGLNCLLDDLLGDVPELAMCYHIDNDVQRYDFVRTDNIAPKPDASTAEMVQAYAPSILAFLKEKANRQGHTYWLFKSISDDNVRLYDLTSICRSYDVYNPYIYPIIELMYRTAFKMCKSKNARQNYQGTIRSLLTQCLSFSRQRKFHDLYCYASYLLSDLFVSEDIKCSVGGDHDYATIADDLDIDCITYSLQALSLHCPESIKAALECAPPAVKTSTSKKQKRSPEYAQTLHDRATRAIEKLAEALAIHEHNRIPLPLVREALENGIEDRDLVSSLYLNNQFGFQRTNRVITIPTLLLQKAFSSYVCLANSSFLSKKYGRCLKCLKIALDCIDSLYHLAKVNDVPLEICKLLVIAGDCYMAISQEKVAMSLVLDQYKQLNDNDKAVEEAADALYGDDLHEGEVSWIDDLGWITMITSNYKHLLTTADRAFYVAIELATDRDKAFKDDCMRRLVGCRNAYGTELIQYVNDVLTDMGLKIWKEGEEDQVKLVVEQKINEALSVLESGLNELDNLPDDKESRVLLLMNTGKVHKTSLSAYRRFNSVDDSEGSAKSRKTEIDLMTNIIDSYQKAEDILRSSKTQHHLFEEVVWERTTNYLSRAFALHEQCSDQLSIDSQYVDSLTHVLADFKSLNPTCHQRQVKLTYLSGYIYHQIATLYAGAIRSTDMSSRRLKQYRGICKNYYENAMTLYHKVFGTSKNLPIMALTELVARKADCATNLMRIGIELFAQARLQWDSKPKGGSERTITVAKQQIQQRISTRSWVKVLFRV